MILYKVELIDFDGYWSELAGYSSLKTALAQAYDYKTKKLEVRVVKEEVVYEFVAGEEYFSDKV